MNSIFDGQDIYERAIAHAKSTTYLADDDDTAPPQTDQRTKTCTRCNVTKPLSAYSVNERRKDGTMRYRSECKACRHVAAGSIPVAPTRSVQHLVMRESTLPAIVAMRKRYVRGGNIDSAGLWDLLMDARAAQKRRAA